MQKIKDNPNLPLFITVGFTILLLMVGIAVLSNADSDPVNRTDQAELLIRENSQISGKNNEEIVLVEFSDFQCPACSYYYEEINKFEQEYGDRSKIVFRHFPLHNIHPLAQKAAEASEAAGSQNKFWKFHDILFENQIEWSSLTEKEAIDKFVKYATKVGIEDTELFRDELTNGVYADKIKRDEEDAEKLNLPGTPSIFLNGEKVENPTFENLKGLLETPTA